MSDYRTASGYVPRCAAGWVRALESRVGPPGRCEKRHDQAQLIGAFETLGSADQEILRLRAYELVRNRMG